MAFKVVESPFLKGAIGEVASNSFQVHSEEFEDSQFQLPVSTCQIFRICNFRSFMFSSLSEKDFGVVLQLASRSKNYLLHDSVSNFCDSHQSGFDLTSLGSGPQACHEGSLLSAWGANHQRRWWRGLPSACCVFVCYASSSAVLSAFYHQCGICVHVSRTSFVWSKKATPNARKW